jgi:hypothetical protein
MMQKAAEVYMVLLVTPARTTKTNEKMTSVFLLCSQMTNNRGKKPSEHEERIKKMCAGYIVNETYTYDLNITIENTASCVVPVLGSKIYLN